MMIERKTVINLLEAYAVAVKHYLRGEDGIYYEDLYYLVKFLPAYALPAGIPSNPDMDEEPLSPSESPEYVRTSQNNPEKLSFLTQRNPSGVASAPHLPLPVGTRRSNSVSKKPNFMEPTAPIPLTRVGTTGIISQNEEKFLLPARMPPKYHFFDLFPFSLLVRALTKRGRELKGKKAAKLRAKMKNNVVSHNLPLEVSLYLVSARYQSNASRHDTSTHHIFWCIISQVISLFCKIVKPPMFQLSVCYVTLPYNFVRSTDAIVFRSAPCSVESACGWSYRSGAYLDDSDSVFVSPASKLRGLYIGTKLYVLSYSIHLWVVTVLYCLALVRSIY